jgi:hypothetical protein
MYKLAIVILVFALLFSGCSAEWWAGDGRGDWTLDLCEGYAISKINSKEILFIHKGNPDDSGGSIVLPNYFVIAYQLHEPYIYLEGIRTQRITASEDELNNKVLSYYLVDTTNDEVVGPFESHDDFWEHGNSLGLEMTDEWIQVNK